MSAIASQITSLTIAYSTDCSRRRSKKASKLRVTGLWEGWPVTFPHHRWPVTSPHKRPVTWKMFPFIDVIMNDAVDWADYQLTSVFNFIFINIVPQDGHWLTVEKLPPVWIYIFHNHWNRYTCIEVTASLWNPLWFISWWNLLMSNETHLSNIYPIS